MSPTCAAGECLHEHCMQTHHHQHHMNNSSTLHSVTNHQTPRTVSRQTAGNNRTRDLATIEANYHNHEEDLQTMYRQAQEQVLRQQTNQLDRHNGTTLASGYDHSFVSETTTQGANSRTPSETSVTKLTVDSEGARFAVSALRTGTNIKTEDQSGNPPSAKLRKLDTKQLNSNTGELLLFHGIDN